MGRAQRALDSTAQFAIQSAQRFASIETHSKIEASLYTDSESVTRQTAEEV